MKGLCIPRLGFIRVGYQIWDDCWGISWGYGTPKLSGRGTLVYPHDGAISFLSHAAWQDYGWWALWPVHFCTQTLGNYDPEVCDWHGETAIFKAFIPSWRWTGRRRVVTAMAITLFGYRWFWRLP